MGNARSWELCNMKLGKQLQHEMEPGAPDDFSLTDATSRSLEVGTGERQ